MNFPKNYWGLFFVLVLSVFSVLPLLNPGFFPMHDDTQVQRVFEMGKALKDGMFPVRWVQNLGYGFGYPIFNFYAPLSYYVGGFFNVLGFDALVSTKIMMILGILMAGIFMYLLAREFWGEVGGIVAGLFYVYAPYHAVDIYVRGDVAEFWAYAFIPLMFFGFYKIYRTSQVSADLAQNSLKFKVQSSKLQLEIKNLWEWVVVGSLGYAGVILSHNLTAMMVTPFLFIVSLFHCFIVYRNNRNLILISLYFILPFMFGLLLSAFYWLPALTEMKYTNVMSQIGGGADFGDHFVCARQLWESQWGFGGSTKDCIDGMSFKLGKIHILLSLITLSLGLMLYVKRKLFTQFNYIKIKNLIAVILAFLGLLVSVVLMLKLSKPIWEMMPFMAFFQYPWRFLILASFFSSFLAGAFFLYLKEVISKYKLPVYINYLFLLVIVTFLFILNFKLFVPQYITSENSVDYTNENEIKWKTSKISDEYLPKEFQKPANINEIIKQKLIVKDGVSEILQTTEKTQKYSFNINVIQKSAFLLSIAPFPSWQAKLNGKDFNLSSTNKGYAFDLDAGKYKMEILFKQTIIQSISNILSVSGLAVLIIGIIYFGRITYGKKER